MLNLTNTNALSQLLLLSIEHEGEEVTGSTEASQGGSDDYYWSCHQPEVALTVGGSRRVCGRGCRDPGVEPSRCTYSTRETHGPHW